MTAPDSAQTGEFNYLKDSVTSSLFRNGRVLTRRDQDGSDAGSEGIEVARHTLSVQNARQLPAEQERTLKANGFELLTASPADPRLDFYSHKAVVEHYYGQCAELVKSATGAEAAFAFDHNVRSAAGKRARQRISGGQQVQGPAHMVHGDYTLFSAPRRLRDLAEPAGANDTLREFLRAETSVVSDELIDRAFGPNGRFAIINVWRNIVDEPVQANPLALCDATSVEPDDLVVFEIHYHDRIGENYFAKHRDRHRWYYYPLMTKSEALLIKQWDSAGTFACSEGTTSDAAGLEAPCTFSFHSAFEDRSIPDDAPDRWSIEVRCMVIY